MNNIKTVSGREFNQIDGKSILESAEAAGINLQYSCRTGRCSSCKCKLIGGITDTINDELGLSKSEKDEGYILSCVRYAKDDIEIQVDDLGDIKLPKAKTIPCKISNLNLLSNDVMQLFLRIPPSMEFNFLPGQYINLISPTGIKRSYSIANNFQDNLIEMHIKKVPKGKFSEYLFNEANENDLLRLNGPHGTFFLRENTKGIIFLATGTGIAPIKSILDSIDVQKGFKSKPIYVVWGGRKDSDIYLDLCGLYKNINFKYFSVLSRPKSNWNGRIGYVQDAILEEKLNLSEYNVYACGLDNMITDAKYIFLKNGLNQNEFFSDAFVDSSDIMLT